IGPTATAPVFVRFLRTAPLPHRNMRPRVSGKRTLIPDMSVDSAKGPPTPAGGNDSRLRACSKARREPRPLRIPRALSSTSAPSPKKSYASCVARTQQPRLNRGTSHMVTLRKTLCAMACALALSAVAPAAQPALSTAHYPPPAAHIALAAAHNPVLTL